MARGNTQPQQLDIPNETIENARLVFRNFTGKPTTFDPKGGSRTFGVLLDVDRATRMAELGWNVKTLRPREEGDEPQPYISVKVNFGTRPPRIVMIASRGRTNLGEDEVNVLDFVDIKNADLILRAYNYDVNGRQGISAYLQALYITIEEDDLERKYADVPESAASSRVWTPNED